MDCIDHEVAKSKTGLSDFHFATGCIFVWASLGPQLVKNPPIMQETGVRFLGGEDTLEKGQATHFSILGLLWWLRQ